MPSICKALAIAAIIPAVVTLALACNTGPTQVIAFDLSSGNMIKITVDHFQTLEQEIEDCKLVVYNLNVAEASGPAVGELSGVTGDDGHVGFVQWQEGQCFGFEAQFSLEGQAYSLTANFAPENFPEGGEVSGSWTRDDGKNGPFTATFVVE